PLPRSRRSFLLAAVHLNQIVVVPDGIERVVKPPARRPPWAAHGGRHPGYGRPDREPGRGIEGSREVKRDRATEGGSGRSVRGLPGGCRTRSSTTAGMQLEVPQGTCELG